MTDAIQRSALRKVYFRLLPIALLTYFLCYVDRINVGFAALTMRTDLKMGAADFGFAAVLFFLAVAEAGFFPGLVLYFTYWFPHHHHARIMSGFLVGLPVAVAV